MVNNFSYPSTLINALQDALSQDRLQSYLKATGGDKTTALQLYMWNTDLSAALYKPLQGLEITLRNAFHRELSKTYGSDWYNQIPHVLTDISNENIAKVIKEINKRGKTATPPRVVAELSFGFWVSLLGYGRKGNDNYEMKLWRPALYKAFSNRPSRKFNRKSANKEFTHIKELRNRIAHHEPIIHKQDVLSEYYRILDGLSWLCKDTAVWVASNSNFIEVFNNKPF
ncbi:MAG: Abi family protein [Cyanobacteria bacterium P01_G01_bin.19]